MHSFWSDLLWSVRDISPFALGCGGIAAVTTVLWYLTKWKEFMLVALTTALYILPFLMWSGH